jgi:hypothetical protein
MKKAKKAKGTKLDRIATQIRVALKRETINILEIGHLLIKSREHLEHGEWQAWLAKNFNLTYRTARRYESAAEYADKNATVSHFANLSPTVLYQLADSCYSGREEAAILTAAHKRRIDEDAADVICAELTPPKSTKGGDDQANDDDDNDDDDTEDQETKAILDGPPPAVPPPAPNPPPADFALADFDKAIGTLNRLKTKSPAQFTETAHSVEALESVEAFLHAVKIFRQREQQK